MSDRGTAKVLTKLQKSLESGDYYEAHQMYLTVCNRYLKQKKNSEAVKLLSDGAKLLVQHQQFGSALELCQMLVDTWIDNAEEIKSEQLELFFDLLNAFPANQSQTEELMKAGLKWTSKCGGTTNADPLMHHQCGVMSFETQKYEAAQNHFLQGTIDSAESLAVLMIAQGKQALESKKIASVEQIANFALRPVLEYLCNKRLSHAYTFYNNFIDALIHLDPKLKSTSITSTAWPDSKLNVVTIPILNFLGLVIVTVQRGMNAVNEFVGLRRNYNAGDNGDIVSQALDRIGLLYFQIQPPRQQANILQEMMRSLFSGEGGAGAGGAQGAQGQAQGEIESGIQEMD